ncbi:chromosome segregation protein SMC, partial [Ligilactobacillus ruminis]
DLENSRVNETRFSEAKKAAQAKLEELEGKIKASQDLLEEKSAFQKNKASEQAKLDAKIAEDAGRLAVLTERIQSLSIRVKENEFQIAQADERIEKNGERIRQLENESKSMLLSKDELIEKEKEADERCLKLEKEVSRMQEERSALHENVKKSETELTRANELLRAAMDERSTLSAKDGNLQATLRQNLDELAEHYAMTYESAEQKNTEEDLDFVKKKVKLLKLGIEELGDVNVNAIAQFEEVNERYEFLRQQQDDLLEAKEQLLLSMEEMDEEVKRRFKVTFNKVSSAFTEIFPEVFGGGHAELSLTDPQNLLETGLEIMAAPPGKKYRQLSLLSGGERSLTAIVLLFAILKVKPVPFAILDEAEAALDDANVARYSQYLRKFDGQTQFIVITHRKGTMMQADVLYGVTMQESGVSKMVSVSLDDYD